MTKPPTRAEIIEALKPTFPKISKAALSMASQEAYGVALSASARRTLQDIYPDVKCAQNGLLVSLTRHPEKRSRSHRLSVRLNDEEYEKFQQKMSESGCNTVQEYLLKRLEETW